MYGLKAPHRPGRNREQGNLGLGLGSFEDLWVVVRQVLSETSAQVFCDCDFLTRPWSPFPCFLDFLAFGAVFHLLSKAMGVQSKEEDRSGLCFLHGLNEP